MISLAPFIESALQVEIGQSPETRNLSHALAAGVVAGKARYNIGLRNSLEVNRLSFVCERSP
jgi:hypothetical protein